MPIHLDTQLLFVVIDNILIGRTALVEGVQIIHHVDVTPQVHEIVGNLEVSKIFAYSMSEGRKKVGRWDKMKTKCH